MGSNYVLNYVKGPLTEDQMNSVPAPKLELGLHITQKTLQAGGLIGTMSAITTSLIKGERGDQLMLDRIARYGKRGMITGLVIGPVLTTAFLMGKKMESDAVKDRCYRIRFNKNQMRVDRMVFLGTATGILVATQLGKAGMMGASLGMSGGILFGAFLNSAFG